MNSTQVVPSMLPPPAFEIEVSNIGCSDSSQSTSTTATEQPAGDPPRGTETLKSIGEITTAGPSNQAQILRCECGKICQRKENLTMHKKFCNKDASTTDFSTSVTFPCPLCSTNCTTNSALQKHQGSQKCIKRQEARAKSVSLTLALSETDSQILESFGLQCDKCKRSFKSKAGMISHAKTCNVSKSNYDALNIQLIYWRWRNLILKHQKTVVWRWRGRWRTSYSSWHSWKSR